MRSWVKQGKEGKSRHMRELLRDYVLILANTGMRHGTESYGLKWKHISFHTGKNGRRYLMMNVDGKTGTPKKSRYAPRSRSGDGQADQ
jgi:hypothetical protein